MKRIKKIFVDMYKIVSRKRFTFAQRFILLYYYIKTIIQNFLNNRLVSYSRTKFLGYEVSFSSFSEFSILVSEIFVEDPYYFESKSKNPSIVDCGGNIGMSVLYFKWLYPQSSITVFEPVPSTCNILRNNISQNNLSGVTIVEKALSNENGNAKIYLREEITLAATMEEREAHGSGECIVETTKLSNYITEKVDFIKIDVQFSEQKVFEDLANANKFSYIEELVMEFHHYFGYETNSLSKTLGYLEQCNLHYHIDLNSKKTEEFSSYMVTARKIAKNS